MAHQLVLDALDHGALLVDTLHAILGEGVDEVHVVEVEGGKVLVVLFADQTPNLRPRTHKRSKEAHRTIAVLDMSAVAIEHDTRPKPLSQARTSVRALRIALRDSRLEKYVCFFRVTFGEKKKKKKTSHTQLPCFFYIYEMRAGTSHRLSVARARTPTTMPALFWHSLFPIPYSRRNKGRRHWRHDASVFISSLENATSPLARRRSLWPKMMQRGKGLSPLLPR